MEILWKCTDSKYNKNIKYCTSRIIIPAKCFILFINYFERLPSNQPVKLKSIKILQTKILYEMFFKHTPLIPFPHRYILLQKKIQIYSEYTLKELYLVSFFFAFTTFNKRNAASKYL